MGGNDPRDLRYAGALDFVDMMSAEDEASVMAFASSYDVVCGFTSDRALLRSCFHQAEEASVGSGTEIGPALEHAVDSIPVGDKDAVVVLLTDGQSDYDGRSIRARAEERGVSIYALGFGDADEVALTATATEDGGYLRIGSAEQIPELYERVFLESRSQSWLECDGSRTWVEMRGQCEAP